MGKTAPPPAETGDTDTDADETPAPATLEIPLLGRTWTVAADSRTWAFETLEALEAGRAVAFLKAVLGPRQWELFATGEGRSVGDAKDLMDAILAATAEARLGE